MADTTKTILPSFIPYGFGFQPDTVRQADIPIMLQKPESADLIKQRADSDALAQPATTQVAIGVQNTRDADKLQKKKATKPKVPPASAPAPEQSAQAPADASAGSGTANTGTAAGSTLTPPPAAPDPEPTPAIANTPDTSDAVETVGESPRAKMIRTVFQTITGKDAIPYGEKWRWYLEHGWTGMHGNRHQELMNQINAETRAFPMQNGQVAGKNTYGQELRAQEMKRRTLMQQWDKLLWEWNHGYYSGNESTVREFYNRADKLRNAMVAEGITKDLIRDPSINAGGFAQGFQKDIAARRNDLDWLGGWLKTIEDNVRIYGTEWLNRPQAQMEFDKMAEYNILKWAQSKGAIADAEKIRAQVESMPPSEKEYYIRFMQTFTDRNRMLQIESLASQGDRHAKALVEEIRRLATAPENEKVVYTDENGLPTVKNQSHIMQLLTLVQASLINNKMNLPTDLATALNSYKEQKDSLFEHIMRMGNVDRKMVYDSAVDQLAINKSAYDRMLPRLGLLEGWQYDGYLPKDKSFGEFLGQWQAQQPIDKVIKNTTVATPENPQDTPDVGGVEVRGGGAGTTLKNKDNKPKGKVPPKEIAGKSPVWTKRGWQYIENGQIKYWK